MAVHQNMKYERLKNNESFRERHSTYIQVIILLMILCVMSVAVYSTWALIYKHNYNIPKPLITIRPDWIQRALTISTAHYNNSIVVCDSFANTIVDNLTSSDNDHKNIRLPSKYGNFIYSNENERNDMRLVCYYVSPGILDQPHELYPNKIDPQLCTHLNIGVITIENSTLKIGNEFRELFKQTAVLKQKNRGLKILLWIGGADDSSFTDMVRNHANRKRFIQSIKITLETHGLDGVDLDWEFPRPCNRERQHFSQLLHEIRREYQREHRTYLLSVAVGAPTIYADLSYDVSEINAYADYVNIMTYDFHFFTKQTPWTGLNAPLYRHHSEFGIFSELNINYTVAHWLSRGLHKSKIVIGLPTYGHSYRLVNAFNAGLQSPAEGFGLIGQNGFVTYPDVCRFLNDNIYVTNVYDKETCSPYLYAGNEWISYDNEQSLECKTDWIKKNGFTGAMIFALNTDDYQLYCYEKNRLGQTFPLVRKIKSILFDNKKLVSGQ